MTYRFSDWAWSIHFWRRLAARINQDGSTSNAVAYSCLRSSGIRSIGVSDPSKYFRSDTITSSHRSRAFRSRTRASFTTVKSPDMFDFTYRFRYVGSIDCATPLMLEIVAVGAIAMMFEFRTPPTTRWRSASQSRRCVRSMSRSPSRASATAWIESIGRMPRLHSDPSKLG